MRAGTLIIRTIGLVRARCKIGLRNLAYNINRYGMLATTDEYVGNGIKAALKAVCKALSDAMRVLFFEKIAIQQTIIVQNSIN